MPLIHPLHSIGTITDISNAATICFWLHRLCLPKISDHGTELTWKGRLKIWLTGLSFQHIVLSHFLQGGKGSGVWMRKYGWENKIRDHRMCEEFISGAACRLSGKHCHLTTRSLVWVLAVWVHIFFLFWHLTVPFKLAELGHDLKEIAHSFDANT